MQIVALGRIFQQRMRSDGGTHGEWRSLKLRGATDRVFGAVTLSQTILRLREILQQRPKFDLKLLACKCRKRLVFFLLCTPLIEFHYPRLCCGNWISYGPVYFSPLPPFALLDHHGCCNLPVETILLELQVRGPQSMAKRSVCLQDSRNISNPRKCMLVNPTF